MSRKGINMGNENTPEKTKQETRQSSENKKNPPKETTNKWAWEDSGVELGF